jgi:hypothetical protein
MILSILIPTKKENKKYLDQLLALLLPQIKDLDGKIEIYIEGDNKMQIGEKMNSLLKDAIGEYVWFLEDTQIVSDTAIQDIFKSVESKPDVINICGGTSLNGLGIYDWKQGIGMELPPDHNNPMKRSLSKSIKFRKRKVDALQIWANDLNRSFDNSDRLFQVPIKITNVTIDKPILHKRIILTKA